MVSPPQRNIQVVLTARDTAARLSSQNEITFSPVEAPGSLPRLEIDPTQTFQEIEGFGGAFTEAAAFALSKMSPEKRTEVIRAYFDPKVGLGYTLCRTHINSCDFSLGNYAYAEVDGDIELKHFSIARDQKLLIPFIKDALATSEAEVKIFASPWSPPAWMKTTGKMNQGGKLKPEYLSTWALYFAKYLKVYAEAGIPIWGVTVQNEPAGAPRWDSCLYSGAEERDFVKKYLGPTLAQEGLGETKIIIWDFNKNVVLKRATEVLTDPEAARYVWGVGVHWYAGDYFENLDKVHRAFPDKKILSTESCQEQGVHLGSWALGERYGHDIIGDLNNWTVGWVDWNMVLDGTGGPNHVGNLCDAPIIANGKTNTLHYQSSYYYLGHFSKFIRPGAVRIGCSSASEALEVTAFRNIDETEVIIIMNRTDQAINLELKAVAGSAPVSSPAHSIMTLTY